MEGVDTCVHTTLKASNGWCVLLDDLAEGVYRIIQKDTMGYHVSYVINGEESNFAKVTLGLNDISIGIINQVRDCSGMLTVTKYVQQEDGSLSLIHIFLRVHHSNCGFFYSYYGNRKV